MKFENGFSIDFPELRDSEVITEGFLRDFVNNVFKLKTGDPRTEITKFKDMLQDPKNLFGKAPEVSPYTFTLSFNPVLIDNKRGVIAINYINFRLLFIHIKQTYDEKNLSAIFYKTYNKRDIEKFNQKRIDRSGMRITTLLSPIFFALELSILFSQLYAKYHLKAYKTIAKTIYEKTWLKDADEKTWKEPITDIVKMKNVVGESNGHVI